MATASGSILIRCQQRLPGNEATLADWTGDLSVLLHEGGRR